MIKHLSTLGFSLVLATAIVTNAHAQSEAAPKDTNQSSSSSLQLSQGVKAFHRGDFEEARKLFEETRSDELDPTQLADLRLLLGRTLIRLEVYDEAIANLKTALADTSKAGGSTLKDHIQWSLAQAYSRNGNPYEASKYYFRILRLASSPLSKSAAFHRAMELEKAGKPRNARKAYQYYLSTWPDAPHVIEAKLLLGHLHAKRRAWNDAFSLYQSVRLLDPDGSFGRQAQEALQSLTEKNVQPKGRRARRLLLDELEFIVKERRFQECFDELQALMLKARAKGDRESELRTMELLAFAHRESGHLEDALKLYEKLEDEGRHILSSSRLAKLYARMGKFDRAERTLRKGPQRKRGRSYWLAVGDLATAFGRYERAEEAYLKAKGKWRARKDLAKKIAWSVLRQAKTEEALELLASIGKRQPKKRAWSKYWSARALQNAGRLEEAMQIFETLHAQNDFSFYGILSASRLAEILGQAPTIAPVAFGTTDSIEDVETNLWTDMLDNFPSTEESLPSSTFHWTRNVYQAAFRQAPAPSDIRERSKSLLAFAKQWGKYSPEAWRAVELDRLGYVDETIDELRVIDADLRVARRKGWGALVGRTRSSLLDNRRTKRGPGGVDIKHHGRRSRKTARKFTQMAKLPLFREALRRAQIVVGDAYAIRKEVIESGRIRQATIASRPEVWKDFYPIAWPQEVSRWCYFDAVPPYFLYGIMTVESAFHPQAVSVSNAYGLLQVIPRTGRRVAQELSISPFSPERLIEEPGLAIRMGSHYLGQLLDKFYGQEPLAAAAYNAGPHRVAEWLESNSDRSMDVFMEEIPYRQARSYARSVLVHTARYRHIYHGETFMYVTNALNPRHQEEPNY
jgi:soluble lytic murein transglycosylase-like protein/TolA-binding protein